MISRRGRTSQPRAVAFFDIDGTLVPGTSSATHLAGFLGHLDAVTEAEAAWDAGLVEGRYVEELDARGWAGTTEAQITEWLTDLPLVDGIGDSRSDLPLFAEVGLAVAFNADEQARAMAHVEIAGPDLRAVLPALENWLEQLTRS
jgi:phosphoserine phosphatase